MPISNRVTDAILALLSDTVSDDPIRETLQTALISPDGKDLVATDGVSLVQVKLSEPVMTANLGDRLDPDAARKLIKAGKYPERKFVDLQFPEFARAIPTKIAPTKDSQDRYDANTPPCAGFDAVLLARVLSGISKVAKAAGCKQAGVMIQYSDGFTPARIDAEVFDGTTKIEIVGVVMPMRIGQVDRADPQDP